MHRGERRQAVKIKGLPLLLGAGMVLIMQGAALASEAGGAGAHGLNWWDFGLRTLNFVILAGVLYKLLNKPISNFFTSRREDIQNLLAELDTKQREAEVRSAEFSTKMAALETETKQIVSEMIAEGEEERKKILEAANRQAEYIKQQAQVAVQQEIKVAMDTLQAEIAELSVAKAEELLRKKMKADDQDRLVRDFMTTVAEAK
jgi:F-type H+-transporting ATPase subunit b